MTGSRRNRVTRKRVLLAAAIAMATFAPGVASLVAPPAHAQQSTVHPDELRKRAANGDVEAMKPLQDFMMRYKNPKKPREPEQRIDFSKEERLKWIRAGAEAGEPYAQQQLALIYGKGYNSGGGGNDYDNFSALVPRDYVESARWARAAAAGFRRNKAAFKYTGIDGGERLERFAQAQDLFAQQSEDLSVLMPLAEAGDKEAIWGVYLVHSVAHTYPDIWDWLAKSVKAGDPRGIIETWRRTSRQSSYQSWENGKPNDWLVMAARLNDPSAMESLGNVYASQAKDDSKALEWYRKAHEAGGRYAEIKLNLYSDATALRLYKAAESGDGQAAYRLAHHYLTGEWNGRNTGEHERWLRKAVELRNTEARYEWGMRTRDGSLLQAAANAGHAGAKAELARMGALASAGAARMVAAQQQQQRTQAEDVFRVLRASSNYDKNGLSPEALHAALQAAQTDSERQLIADENARRVADHMREINASSGYRPVQVTPYVPQQAAKTDADFAREHQAFKDNLVARLREVVR